MLKAAGVMMVVISCSMTGFEFAARLNKRKENLENIKKGILAMERDMQFFKYPLHTVFSSSASVVSKEVGELFSGVAKESQKSSWDAEAAWRLKIEMHWKELYLTKEEKEKIKNIFSGLGKTDSIMQKKIMASALENMRNIIDECHKVCDKNIKIYRSLGVLSGLFLALIFI